MRVKVSRLPRIVPEVSIALVFGTRSWNGATLHPTTQQLPLVSPTTARKR